jgi:Uma2 family endonuclease
MVASKPKPATYADLAALPADVVGELIAGGLHASPRPGTRHVKATSEAIGDLFGPYHRGRGGPGGWWLLSEPELHLGDDFVVPDLAGWRRSRLPSLPSTAAIELAPDWVCEALSPSTARLDRHEKMPLYARAGVSHLWLIDATIRTLEVFRLQEGHWLHLVTHAEKERAHIEPFGEVEIDLALWWLD